MTPRDLLSDAFIATAYIGAFVTVIGAIVVLVGSRPVRANGEPIQIETPPRVTVVSQVDRARRLTLPEHRPMLGLVDLPGDHGVAASKSVERAF
jgi:hypothetical protein